MKKISNKLIILTICFVILILLITLLTIKIESEIILSATLIEDKYYLKIIYNNEPIYYIIEKRVYLLNDFHQMKDDLYVIDLKFHDNFHPIFFQVEKNISLMTYLFTAIFKI